MVWDADLPPATRPEGPASTAGKPLGLLARLRSIASGRGAETIARLCRSARPEACANRSKGARNFPVTEPDGFPGVWPPDWWPSR